MTSHSTSRSVSASAASLSLARGQGTVARLVRLSLSLLVSLQLTVLPGVASAQIIADPRAPQNQQPQVIQAGNGVPVVNIQTPSAAGVSRNTYQQFDVNRQGAILNNAQKNVATQTSGWIQGNPNLNKGSARIILNEVNSTSPSQLRGYMEIAGSKAQLVVANPSGITCDGCGFINVNRATLTTGTPIFQDGNLTGYRVQGGRITIEGQGLDARGTDYTDIITRAVTINSGLWAEHLNMVTGTNQVSADLSQITPIAADPNDPKPKFALDVASLGGMYARSIYLIGTEAGLGVINAGHIGAGVGDVIITVDGRLESKGSLNSTGNTQITARQGIQNDGTLYAQGNVALNTSGDITNSSVIAAAGNTSLTAGNTIQGQSGSLIAAGLQSDNTLAYGTLSLSAGQLIQLQDSDLAAYTQQLNAAELQLAQSRLQGNALYLASRGNADLQGTRISASDLLQTQISGTLDTRSAQIAAAQLQLSAQHLNNQAGQLLQTGTSTGYITTTGTLNNQDGQIISNGQNLQLTATTLNNSGGTLISNGKLTANLEQLNNQNGSLTAVDQLSLTATGALTNTAGLIRAGGNLKIQVDSLDNRNTQGSNQGIEAQSLAFAIRHIDNTGGALRAQNAFTVSSRQLDNNNGLISSAQTLSLGGTSSSAGDSLTITNAGGTLIAGNNLSLIVASLSGIGDILSQGDMALTFTGSLTNGSRIIAEQNLQLSVANTLNNQGTIQAGGVIELLAQHLENTTRAELSGSVLTLNLDSLTNRGLIDGGRTWIQSQTINNLGTGRLYGDYISILTHTLNQNSEGSNAPVIAARDRLYMGLNTLDNREHSLIFSAGNLNIGAIVDSEGTVSGQANRITNASATIEALGHLQLAANTLENLNLHHSVEEILVSQTYIEEYQGMGFTERYLPSQIYFRDVRDDYYQLVTPDSVRHDKFYLYQYTRTVTETREASSDPGRILSGGMMVIDAGTVLNDKSQIIAGEDLTVAANTLTNTEVKGLRTVTDAGIAIFHKDHQPGGSGNDWTEKQTTAYNPAPFETQIDLTPTVYLAYSAPSGSNYGIGSLNTGNVNQQPGTVVAPTSVGNIITIPPNIRFPNNSLYTLNPDPNSRYLVETDPRFVNYRQWLNSDYLLGLLNIDMANIQKRLGDGFYEQQLIREQIGQLTGRRFLEGYADDEAQYQALLNAGATFAQAHQLIPGVGLTEAQMAALTSDIVWLVEKEVTLPDGSTTRALVPQVYALVQPGDLQGNGALMAGRNIDMQVAGKILNQGRILGQENILLQADNITNQGGSISGNTLTLDAQTDIEHLGGLLEGKSNLYLLAGRDIKVTSSTGDTQSTQGARTHLNQVASILTRNPEGMLIMDAFRDINLKAADIRNEAEGGQTLIAAGRDLTLETLKVSARQDLIFDKKNTRKENASTEIGTSIATQGDLTLLAGNNLTARAATISSSAGGITAQAGKDILLTSGEENSSLYSSSYTKSKGSWGSTREVTTRDYTQSTQALGTLLSGETVQMQAGQDITLHGSQALSTQAMSLTAGRDINLQSAQETRQETHYYNKKQKGIFSTGGAGIMIGKQEQSTDGMGVSTYAAGSTVGSVEGDITLVAGRNYTQTGSHVVAPGGDIGIAADQILIQEARETDAYQQKTKFKQSGLTVALSNPIISAIQMTEQMNKSASRVGDDPRQKAMAAASSIFAIDNALGSINPAGSNPVQQAGGLNISASLGSSKSESENRRNSNTASGSTVTAGGSIILLANTENRDGNITIQGSDLTAGKNMTLIADRDIQLLAAQNTSEQHSKNKSSSSSVGVSVGVGANGGIGVSAVISANKGRGNADGSSVAWSNSHLLAGDILTLISGGDLTLRGATAQGDTLLASVGGNLIVESLQDTDRYKSKQSSSGFSLTIPIYGTNAGASISKSKTNIDSTYRSVTEQSALKAGDGGFGVDVGGNTTLVGGAIVSTQEAIDRGNNYFNTGGELTLTDLKNKAEYEGKGYGINIGAVPSPSGTFTPGGSSGGIGHESGEAESTTYAAISDMAGKESARTGDKETGIDKIFDAEKVQQSIDAQIEITRNFGQQASKLVGNYAATQIKTATDLRERASNTTDQALADSLNAQAQLLEDEWGANGTMRLAAHTLIGGLTGGWEGAVGSTVGTLTSAEVESTLRAGGMDATLTKALSTLASTLAGGAVGGTTGASTAFNEVTNNYLDHVESWALYVATKNCSAANPGACAERDRLKALDDARDAKMMMACGQGLTETCKQLMHEATIAMGTLPFDRGSNIFGSLPKDYIAQISEQYSKNDIAYRIASGEKPEDIQASNKNYNLIRYVSGLAAKALTVAGDVDDFINAETPGDYAWFVAGIIPGVGETRKALNGLDELNDARKILSKTDEAADLTKAANKGDELILPGMDRPVRPINPNYPPNPAVLEAMGSSRVQGMAACSKSDCSEIADKLLSVAGGKGNILEVRPNQKGTLNLFENGKPVDNIVYHQVYTDGRYVYDPRLSTQPIPKGDWEIFMKKQNQNGISIKAL